MTRERLKQYLPEQAERKQYIAELREALRPVEDTVVGSSAAFPYTQHTITVRGISGKQAAAAETLRGKIARLEQRAAEVEAWIEAIDDVQLRLIFRMRYLRGMSWCEVARRVGGGNSVSAVKMKISRFLSKL